MLNTKELNEFPVGEHYLGAFPANKLPKLTKASEIGLISNTQKSHLPGSHWVAIYIKNREGEYFDSFGQYPNRIIEKWLNANTLSWTRTRRIFQHPERTTSGAYCLYYLSHRPFFVKPMNRFNSDLVLNEKKLACWLIKL
jgi:hypothetical protein